MQPSPEQLQGMRALVRQAMEEGALGVSSALIYTPATFAKTDELAALATEAGMCGGIYITHMRSEGDRLLEAVDETISIARQSGAPAEIYHLKAGGKSNWPKLDEVIAKVNAARKSARITAGQGIPIRPAVPDWTRQCRRGFVKEASKRGLNE